MDIIHLIDLSIIYPSGILPLPRLSAINKIQLLCVGGSIRYIDLLLLIGCLLRFLHRLLLLTAHSIVCILKEGKEGKKRTKRGFELDGWMDGWVDRSFGLS